MHHILRGNNWASLKIGTICPQPYQATWVWMRLFELLLGAEVSASKNSTVRLLRVEFSPNSSETIPHSSSVWVRYGASAVCLKPVSCSVFVTTLLYLIKSKGKVPVLSPHPGSEPCSADYDKCLPWSLRLYSPYIHLNIHLNSLGSIQPLTHNLAPWLTNHPAQVPIRA